MSVSESRDDGADGPEMLRRASTASTFFGESLSASDIRSFFVPDEALDLAPNETLAPRVGTARRTPPSERTATPPKRQFSTSRLFEGISMGSLWNRLYAFIRSFFQESSGPTEAGGSGVAVAAAIGASGPSPAARDPVAPSAGAARAGGSERARIETGNIPQRGGGDASAAWVREMEESLNASVGGASGSTAWSDDAGRNVMVRDFPRCVYAVDGEEISGPSFKKPDAQGRPQAVSSEIQMREARNALVSAGVREQDVGLLSKFLHQGIFADVYTGGLREGAPVPYILNQTAEGGGKGSHFDIRTTGEPGVYRFTATCNKALSTAVHPGSGTFVQTDEARSSVDIEIKGECRVDDAARPIRLMGPEDASGVHATYVFVAKAEDG